MSKKRWEVERVFIRLCPETMDVSLWRKAKGALMRLRRMFVLLFCLGLAGMTNGVVLWAEEGQEVKDSIYLLDRSRWEESDGAVRRWRQMTPQERQRLKKNWQKFKKLTPEEQRDLGNKFGRWERLSETERHRFREKFKKLRALSPEQRQGLLRNKEKWEHLSEAERRFLKEKFCRFRSLTPEKRREFLRRHPRWRDLSPRRREVLRRQMEERRLRQVNRAVGEDKKSFKR